MPIATITTATLSPTLTQAAMLAAIDTAMQAAGFAPAIDTIGGATLSNIYSYQVAAAAKGTAFLRVDVNSSLQVRQSLSDNWDSVADTSTGATSQNYSAFTSTNALTLYSINHPELRLVFLLDGSTHRATLGYLRPATKEAFWNEASHLFCFHPSPSASWLPAANPAPGPWGANSAQAQPSSLLIDLPPTPALPQLVAAPFWFGTSVGSRCLLGRFSSDVALAPTTGLAFLYRFQVAGQEYALLPVSNVYGLAIRSL